MEDASHAIWLDRWEALGMINGSRSSSLLSCLQQLVVTKRVYISLLTDLPTFAHNVMRVCLRSNRIAEINVISRGRSTQSHELGSPGTKRAQLSTMSRLLAHAGCHCLIAFRSPIVPLSLFRFVVSQSGLKHHDIPKFPDLCLTPLAALSLLRTPAYIRQFSYLCSKLGEISKSTPT